MIRKLAIVSAAVGAALVLGGGLSAAEADPDVDAQNDKVVTESYGGMPAGGYMSPQIGLIQGSLNKPCIALPIEDVHNIVALLNVGVQDILSDQQNQQCIENSAAVKGDAALSHILENVLSENGSASVDG